MRIAILGAGAWGTALAMQAAGRHDVRLWARDAAQAAQMARERENTRYLPGAPWPEALRVDADLGAVLAHAAGPDGLNVIATPVSGLAATLAVLPPGAGAAWLCKGFERETLRLPHEIAREQRPDLRVAALSGPSFAIEVARGQPTALVAASADAAFAERVAQAFHAQALRVYTSDDLIGVEVGGAMKNVLAIATGIADGLHLGLNARAALVTRGLAEMTRLGLALGAQAATFMGLSGLGDLVLTTTGDLSRNRQVGLRLAEGHPLDQVLHGLGHVAEGVATARMAARRAAALGVELPITATVVQVLDGGLSPRQAVERLLARDARAEGT